MKKIVLIFIFLFICVSADVVMQKAHKEDPEISLTIVKPVRPIRPIINTGIVYQDNYYAPNYEINCDRYIEILAQKNQEILELKQEIESLKNKEQSKMQKNLKEAYDKEMQKFENRKSSINVKNSALLSNEPID